MLDVGCGKGGDLKKFNFEKISNYVGIDISIRALKDAIIRKCKSNIHFPALFISMSGDTEPLNFDCNLPNQMYFDLVSAQFCIHYFFSKENATRNFLANVSGRLTEGGIFIASFPDSEVIMKKLGDSKINEEQYVYNSKYYSLLMPTEETEKNSVFGIKYGFFLDDGLIGKKEETPDETKIYFVPEFLIVLNSFIQLAAEYNLEVVESLNCHEFYQKYIGDPEHFAFFKSMNFFKRKNERDLMEEAEWDCSYLYRTIMFRKKNGVEQTNLTRNYRESMFFKLVK